MGLWFYDTFGYDYKNRIRNAYCNYAYWYLKGKRVYVRWFKMKEIKAIIRGINET
jgi:hypothetical protein